MYMLKLTITLPKKFITAPVKVNVKRHYARFRNHFLFLLHYTFIRTCFYLVIGILFNKNDI